MRKLKRQIKRGYIDRIKPGDKPNSMWAALRIVSAEPSFRQWRDQLRKSAAAWRKKYGVV